MVDIRDKAANGETDVIIDEYRRRISQALEKERSLLIQFAEQESKELIARAREQAKQIIDDAREKAGEESTSLVLQARQMAEHITKDANQKAQEEAREKTRREVDRIIARSKDDADRVAARTLEGAQQEAEGIVAAAKKQAEQVAREAREKALLDTRSEADAIIEKSKLEAAQIIKDYQDKAAEEAKKESSRIISEAEQISGQITNSARLTGIKQGKEQVNELLGGIKEKLQDETGRLVAETMQRVESLIEKARIEVEDEVVDRASQAISEEKPADEETDGRKSPGILSQDQEPEFSDRSDGKGTVMAEVIEGRLYQGLLNLEVIHPVENDQLVNLRKYLLQVPGMQLVSTGGSVNKNVTKTVYTVVVKSPTPLIKILKGLPPIESVAAQKKQDIAIKLR